MAFIGLLIANGLIILVIIILLAMALLGLISLILSMVFLYKYKKNKQRQIKKTWQKVVSIICMVIAILNLGLTGSVVWKFTHPGPATTYIDTEHGREAVLREDGFTLEYAIKYDDVKTVKEMLEENPAFWDYTDIGGSTILGLAIANGSIEVAEYLLQNGFEADHVGKSGKDTALGLYCRAMEEEKYSIEMFRLLLKYQASVTGSVAPLLCDIVEGLCSDGILTDDEVDLLSELVNAGLSRENTNGLDENAEAVFERLIIEKELESKYSDQVERAKKLLRE